VPEDVVSPVAVVVADQGPVEVPADGDGDVAPGAVVPAEPQGVSTGAPPVPEDVGAAVAVVVADHGPEPPQGRNRPWARIRVPVKPRPARPHQMTSGFSPWPNQRMSCSPSPS